MFKEKEIEGVTLKMNRLTEKKESGSGRDMDIEKSFYHVKTDIQERARWFALGVFCVCVCSCECVREDKQCNEGTDETSCKLNTSNP